MSTVKLESSWLEKLGDEFEKPYMKNLSAFLKNEIKNNKQIVRYLIAFFTYSRFYC